MLRSPAEYFSLGLATALLAAMARSTSMAQELSVTNWPDPVEELVFRAWGTETGLPQNTVNAIVQTRDGYVWVGTRDGLARFDGVRFTVFGLWEGLPSVEVQSLYEDSHGTLWIGTSGGGLSRWDGGHIQTVSFPPYLAASGTISSLAEDATGRLWIGTRAGLIIWERGRFTQYSDLAWLGHSGIRTLLYDHSGAMWIATLSQGLYQFRNNRLEESVNPAGTGRIHAYCLLEDVNSNLWVSIGNGTVLCRHEGKWRSFTETNGLPFAYVTCLAQDRDGTIWAGSLDDGLYCFKAGRFFGIHRQQGLSANDIRSLCPDREGHLWVGTRTGGLDRLSHRKLARFGAAQGLTNDYTRSVAQTADGTLWVGTTGGGLYRGRAKGFEQVAPFYSWIESVLPDGDGGLWLGAARGLLRLQTDGIISGYTNEPWVVAATVTALCHDGQSGLWIGTSEGRLVHFQNGAFHEMQDLAARGPITGLASEPAGPLWVGSMAGGLMKIDPANGTNVAISKGLLSQAIRTLYLDGAGALWIGTAGGGLSCYRYGRITTFTAQEGFSANTVVQIVEDDRGFLWLGTSRGVFRVSKPDLQELADGKSLLLHPRVFGINEGMPAEECSSGFFPAGLKTKAGMICISTVKGLVFFDPQSQVANSPPLNVLLEEVLANGQVQQLEPEPGSPAADSANVDSGSAPSTCRVALPPGSRELEIHYTGIDFGSPEKLRFRYRLEGADHDWVEAGERRAAYYHHVPPGRFLFRVLACNADGIWSSTGPTLALTVKPYLWETPWFLGLATVTAVALLAGAIRLMERRRFRRRLAFIEMRHAVERERLRISRDMHDDVGSILTQVSQLSDLGRSEIGGPSAAKGHFERIGNQARAAVQALDELVWTTNPKNDNLPGFAEYICRFADEWFENSPARCWQEVPTSLPKAPLRADVRHNVFLAIKEAFNNVSKHSGASEVWLRLSLKDSEACVSVEDNGSGFEPEKVDPGGNGLANMKMRLADSNGRMELTSAPDRGTKILFFFPLLRSG